MKERTEERTETHACDLISRQALCEYALNQKDKSVTPNDIMRFPSAQPDLSAYSDKLWRAAYERGKREGRKRGKWVKVSADKYRISASYFYECSECKFVNGVKSNFCPVCGAAMGGLENDKA